jgi:hypothetical protein
MTLTSGQIRRDAVHPVTQTRSGSISSQSSRGTVVSLNRVACSGSTVVEQLTIIPKLGGSIPDIGTGGEQLRENINLLLEFL